LKSLRRKEKEGRREEGKEKKERGKRKEEKRGKKREKRGDRAACTAERMAEAQKPPTRRLGQVVELKEECVAEYTRVHADGFPGVRDLLSKWNLRNFSIFMQVVAGKRLLFLYGEYCGKDYDADMAGLGAEPRDIEWHKLCDPMQASFNPTGGWLPMDCVYYNP